MSILVEDSGYLWRTVATCGVQWLPEEGQQASCGGQWLLVEDSGYLRRTEATCGGYCLLVKDSGLMWRTVATCGGQWLPEEYSKLLYLRERSVKRDCLKELPEKVSPSV